MQTIVLLLTRKQTLNVFNTEFDWLIQLIQTECTDQWGMVFSSHYKFVIPMYGWIWLQIEHQSSNLTWFFLFFYYWV